MTKNLRYLSEKQAQAVRDRAFGLLLGYLILAIFRPFVGGWVLMILVGILYHAGLVASTTGYGLSVLIFVLLRLLLRGGK